MLTRCQRYLEEKSLIFFKWFQYRKLSMLQSVINMLHNKNLKACQINVDKKKISVEK